MRWLITSYSSALPEATVMPEPYERSLRRFRSLLAALVVVLVAVSTVAGQVPCVGDCSGDGSVTVDELVRGVGIAQGAGELAACPAFDSDVDGGVAINELVAAVTAALEGCLPRATATEDDSTPTLTPTPTQTPTPTLSVGPRVTFLGIVTADNRLIDPIDTTSEGYPIYSRPVASGFLVVVEARRGTGGRPIGTFGTVDSPSSGSVRADLQILVSRPLGDGSAAVCDTGPFPDAPIGGVPGTDPLEFGPGQQVTDALNDLACRFDVHLTSARACTFDDLGNFSFAAADSERQFCTVPAIGIELRFPSGDTDVVARVLDTDDNVGSTARMVVRVP